MSTVLRIHRALDNLLSPPPNYANFTYSDRITNLVNRIAIRKQPVRTSVFLLRLYMMLIASYIFYPVALLLRSFGFRFCNIDLAQIGSVIYLDLFLRDDILIKQTPKYKILALASKHTDGNRYLLDLYNDRVTFIRNPILKFFLSPFFVSNVFDDNSFKYDLTYHTKTVAHDIWKKYEKKYKVPLISFPEKDAAKAKKILEPFVPKDAKFIALHVRDNGFYGISSQTTRNADIFTYQKAIEYLISKGYYVIRLGDPKMIEAGKLSKHYGASFFDYAHSNIRSEMLDCYLLSHCDFFIGLASGPASVPMLFNIGSCNVNWYNASNAPNFISGDITSFKKFYYKKDNSLVPFENLMREPFTRNPKQDILDQNGIYFKDNTEQEIFETVKEYVETSRETLTDRQKMAQDKILKTNYAYGANGAFSDTILKSYFP